MKKRILNIVIGILLLGISFQYSPGVAYTSLPEFEARLTAFDCSTATDVDQSECEALVALYNSTNGAGWADKTGWLESTTVGSWYGVTVVDGHVTKLELHHNQLNGQIPPELENLSSLKDLALAFNQLDGEIPAWLGNLTNLENLALGENHFSGEIPSELGNLVNLTSLLLFNNQLTGSIPPELGNLSKLVHLHLNQNEQMSGSIPPELGNLSSLQHLWLSDIQFSGGIPAELGNLNNLRTLIIDHTQVSGSIPPELGDLTNLEELNLQHNQLSGSIPPELGNLSNLRLLWLNFNQLSGDVPAAFINLVNLCLPGDCDFSGYGLDLGYNRLNVPAPEPPASFLATKDPDWHQTQTVEETLPGNTGGTITSNDEKTEIEVPPDAVEGEVTFTFEPQPSPSYDTGSLSFIGNSFELTAADSLANPITTFDVPLTITLYYDEASLGDITEDNLRLHFWDAGMSAWMDVAGTCPAGTYTRDFNANWLSVPVCHLSEFALLGEVRQLIFLPMVSR